MSIIKCPVCKYVSWIPGVMDGEMAECVECKSRYTITQKRRVKVNVEENKDEKEENKKTLHYIIKGMDVITLLELMQLASYELEKRYKKCIKNKTDIDS